MKRIYTLVFCCLLLSCITARPDDPQAEAWVTTASGRNLLIKTTSPRLHTGIRPARSRIAINTADTGRPVIGFGASLTEASATLIIGAKDRNEIMQELFSSSTGIGISLVRISIGACDFSLDTYSYRPTPDSEFSVARDDQAIIPLLRQAMEINSDLKVIACPWSAPAWMKDNNSMLGVKAYLYKETPAQHADPDGTLKPEALSDYARYLSDFVSAYAGRGIPVFAVSLQNEPMHLTPDYPSMHLPAGQAAALSTELSRILDKKTRILLWEHNYSENGVTGLDYIQSVFQNPEALSAIWGTSWHGYSGDASIMGSVATQFQEKAILFTEQTGEQSHSFGANLEYFMAEKFMPAAANGAQGLMAWNICVDTKGGPRLETVKWNDASGLLIRDKRKNKWTRTGEYAAVGHFARFVKPQARMVATQNVNCGSLKSCAYVNPDGSLAVILFNAGSRIMDLDLVAGSNYFSTRIAGGSAMTIVIRGLVPDKAGLPSLP